MSATANLFAPENEVVEDELDAPPARDALWSYTPEYHLQEPSPQAANWEGMVGRYEPRLNAANGAVLHLGAGCGELMETLRQHGFTVMGCERLLRPARLAHESRGFDARTLHCSSTENFLGWMRRIGQRAQAIFFRHDLEHCLELQALLPMMADILCDNGLLISQLPPPSAEYPHEAHLSFLNELAVACASCNGRFEVEGVDCDYENRFMAFVLKKTFGAGKISVPAFAPPCVRPR